MPLPVAAIAAGAGVVSGVGQLISGANNLKEDKRELERLTPAYYKIQDEYYNNRNLAGQLATGGLPQASKDYYTEEAGRGLGASLGAITQAGGSPNAASQAIDQYYRGIKGVASEDASRQLENIRYFMDKNKELAGQKTTQWAINEYQPYQRKLKELTERIAADKTNIWGGIGTAIGSGSALGTSLENSKLVNAKTGAYNRLFNNQENPVSTYSGVEVQNAQPAFGKFGDPAKALAYKNFSQYINQNWSDNSIIPEIAGME